MRGDIEYDAIVIGGGSGGLAFAREAARCGARVMLVEKDLLGGTCVNRGCVPKKLLWEAAWPHALSAAAAERDWRAPPPIPDFGKLMQAIGEKTGCIRDSYAAAFDADRMCLRQGTAALTAPGEVVIGGETLRARHIVLATGARPARPGFDGADLAETSDDVFSWSSLPRSLILLGGGYIGCEFAAIFAALGVRVALVDPGDRLLSGFDADLANAAAEVFEQRGIALHLGQTPERLEPLSGGFRLRLDDGSSVEAERVVAATGRTHNTDLPGGLSARLDIADAGAFAVDPGLQTSAPSVFAIGDCADRLSLTPVATRDGEVLAQRLYGDACPELIDLSLVATSAFVMPPVAQVGVSEHHAAKTDSDLICGALVPQGHWTGQTVRKVMARDGQLCGVAAMGASAPDIVTALGAAIAGDPRSATGIHPTFAQEFVGRD
ncbi:MAG: dihydrolipoyl dehydrogenase family protein [Paracoccaceae bacterium]